MVFSTLLFFLALLWNPARNWLLGHAAEGEEGVAAPLCTGEEVERMQMSQLVKLACRPWYLPDSVCMEPEAKMQSRDQKNLGYESVDFQNLEALPFINRCLGLGLRVHNISTLETVMAWPF
ncbi:hypothetical protein DFH06DRAFT_1152812 [Mycena polygramma]|nr:hypothetical protein DFH06DRAFT_1152812 [Mycena polygramma]